MSLKMNRDYFNRLELPNLVLCKGNKERIGFIKYKALTYDRNFAEYDEMNFVTPLYFDGQERNPLYDLIDVMKFVLVPDIGYFVIDKVDITSEGTYAETKSVTIRSIECLLAQKTLNTFVINMGTPESVEYVDPDITTVGVRKVVFYNMSDPERSLLNLVLRDKGWDWSIGHVDSTLERQVRSFQIDSKDIYSFLTEDVANAFDCFFEFDTLNNEINVYDADSYGIDTNVFVSYENLLKAANVSCDCSDIKTCWDVSGENDMDLREINLGNPCIYDLSYYLNEDYMSRELLTQYNAWKAKCDARQQRYKNLSVERNGYVKELYDLYTKRPETEHYKQDWLNLELYPNNSNTTTRIANELKEYGYEPTGDSKAQLRKDLVGYSAGGNVDLSKRPIVPRTELTSKGWTVTEDEPQTALIQSYSVSTTGMNFTPIVTDEDGNYLRILTPSELTTYATAVIQGTRQDDLRIKVGKTFFGTNALTEAYKEAKKIEEQLHHYYLEYKFTEDDVYKNTSPLMEIYDTYNIYKTSRDSNVVSYMCSKPRHVWPSYTVTPNDPKMPDNDLVLDGNEGGYQVWKASKYNDTDTIKLTCYYKPGSTTVEMKIENYTYDRIVSVLNLVKAQIESMKTTIENKNKQINNVSAQLSEIQKDVAAKNNFSEKAYSEFCTFIREDSFSTNNFAIYDSDSEEEREQVENDLMEYALKHLHETASPQLSFSADILNLYEIPEFNDCTKDLDVGSYVHIALRDDYYVKVKVIALHINYFDPSDIQFTFANIKRVRSGVYLDIQTAINNANAAATSVSRGASGWSKSVKRSDEIAQILKDGLLHAGNYLNTTSDTSEMVIDKRGIFVNQTSGNRIDSIYMGNGRILFSEDNWNTVAEAIGRVKIENKEVFGVLAQAMVAGYVYGSVMKGNDITGGTLQSLNYTPGQYGTYMDLQNGTFEFNANGSKMLVLDHEGLKIWGKKDQDELLKPVTDTLKADYSTDSALRTWLSDPNSTPVTVIQGGLISTGFIHSGNFKSYINLDSGSFNFGGGKEGSDGLPTDNSSATHYVRFNSDTGKLEISGELKAASGTFNGQLLAATGTFMGDLSAAGGTFDGQLVAATGTFMGDLQAAGGTFKGRLVAATGTFEGNVTAGSININNKFEVDSSGNVTATSVHITGGTNFELTNNGVVTLKAGTIGGWNITANGITSPGDAYYFWTNGVLKTQSVGNSGDLFVEGEDIFLRCSNRLVTIERQYNYSNPSDTRCDFRVADGNFQMYGSGRHLAFYYPTADGKDGVGFWCPSTNTIAVTSDLTDHNDTGKFRANVTSTSDLRLKKIIDSDMNMAEELIMNLQPFIYKWDNYGDDTQYHMGLGAQQVEGVLSQLGMYDYGLVDIPSDLNVNWAIAYSELFAPMIKVIQKQKRKIDNLEERITRLEELIERTQE